MNQSLRFTRPVRIGDEIAVNLEVTEKREGKGIVKLACEVVNQDGKVVVSGEATVMAPDEKVGIDKPDLPRFKVLD